MSFRARLLILISLAVCLTAGLVTWIAVARMRSAYESLDSQRTAALVAQFRNEFQRRGEEVVRQVTGIAQAESVMQLAIALSHPESDLFLHVDEAAGLAAMNNLDFLELMDSNGDILSSAQWPARFGYKADWIIQPLDWNSEGYFLKSEELQEEIVLALVAVRIAIAGDTKLYVAGGCRLGREFLSSLVLQKGVRVLLYPNLTPQFSPQALIVDSGVVNESEKLRPLVEQVMVSSKEASRTIFWKDGDETVHAIPLLGRDNNLLGMFLVVPADRQDVGRHHRGKELHLTDRDAGPRAP